MKCVPYSRNRPLPQNQILARSYPQEGGGGEGGDSSKRKYRRARPTSLRIWALSASGEGNFCSSRSRIRKQTSIGSPVSSTEGGPSSRCDSTAKPAPSNVGREPAFVTALKIGALAPSPMRTRVT